MPLPLQRRASTVTALCALASVASAVSISAATADSVDTARARAAAAAAAAGAARTRVAGEEAHIAAVQRQLAALDVQSEIAAEAYNGAVERLGWADRVAGAARQRLQAATDRLLALRGQAGEVAVATYQTGGLSQLTMLTDTGGPASFLDRAAALDALAHSQRATLDRLETARHEQAFAKVAAEAALARQRQLTDAKRRERDAVLSAARSQQQLLGQLQDAQAQLVAQAQAALAKADAAKQAVQAALAQRALAQAQAQAAALGRQRAAQAQAAAAFRAASDARQLARAAGEVSHSRRHGRLSAVDVGPSPSSAGRGSGGAAVAVAWAYREIGKPYVWAADGPEAFDCSGLTQYVWGKAGIYLGHFTGFQIDQGRRVGQSDLVAGDLVFFGSPIHHVGLYVGSGMMIDAPHTGAFVRKEPVWWPQYAGAVRPAG